MARFARSCAASSGARFPPPTSTTWSRPRYATRWAAGRVPDNAVDVRRWLVRIARNKATDHFRRRRRDVPLESDSIAVETAHTAADPDAQVFLAHAVEDLVSDPGTRSTLELSLREADGETYAEIARGSAFSAATLRQRVSRFRRAMAAAATLLIVLASAAVVSHRRSVAHARHLSRRKLRHARRCPSARGAVGAGGVVRRAIACLALRRDPRELRAAWHGSRRSGLRGQLDRSRRWR